MRLVTVLAQKQTDKITFASKVIHYLNSCTTRMSLESNGEKKQWLSFGDVEYSTCIFIAVISGSYQTIIL